MSLNRCLNNAWNPQSNAILEQIHQILVAGLVTFNLEGTSIDKDIEDPFDECSIAILYAICN